MFYSKAGAVPIRASEGAQMERCILPGASESLQRSPRAESLMRWGLQQGAAA